MPDDSQKPSPLPLRPPPPVSELATGVRAKNRALLGRAITLVESTRADHQQQAQELLAELMPHAGGAHRIGITGVPGVGKSTFIETLGTRLTAHGHQVAVLAVDPSSTVTGGSILGDKTRMGALSNDPHAFVRPSPSAGTLGGVANRTRESMLILEAAGFDIILIETVGVGQSEIMVADMTDLFLALMLPNAGDELQGIKRGILELADLVVVNKADGAQVAAAERAAAEYRQALHYMPRRHVGLECQVLTCSARTGEGMDAVWAAVASHRGQQEQSGNFARRRESQLLRWMWKLVDEQLRTMQRTHPAVQAKRRLLEPLVLSGQLAPPVAARELLAAFGVATTAAEIVNTRAPD